MIFDNLRRDIGTARASWIRQRELSLVKTNLKLIKLRQAVFEGDRSDEFLQKLDKLLATEAFTFPSTFFPFLDPFVVNFLIIIVSL